MPVMAFTYPEQHSGFRTKELSEWIQCRYIIFHDHKLPNSIHCLSIINLGRVIYSSMNSRVKQLLPIDLHVILKLEEIYHGRKCYCSGRSCELSTSTNTPNRLLFSKHSQSVICCCRYRTQLSAAVLPVAR